MLSVALVVGCSAGDDVGSVGRGGSRTPVTMVIDGESVEVARLTDAVSGLCEARGQAATEPRTAKATYDRRSQYGVDTTARILRRSYSRQAAAVTKARDRVHADLATEAASATLADDLGRLTELLREGLARLGITTRPCER